MLVKESLHGVHVRGRLDSRSALVILMLLAPWTQRVVLYYLLRSIIVLMTSRVS